MNRTCRNCKKKVFTNNGGINDQNFGWFCSVNCHIARLEEIVSTPVPPNLEADLNPHPAPPPEPKTPEKTHESPPSLDSAEATPPESPQTDTEPPPKKKRSRRKKKPTTEE